MRAVQARWLVVALALASAAAFAVSVQAGAWWSVGEVQIGPFSSRQCFGGECRPAGLGWIGGTERWLRTGVGTWAGGLLSALVLVVTAAAVAARRVPRTLAKMGLASVVTTTLAGLLFVVQYPGVTGAGADRGLWLFAAAVVLGTASTVIVLRRPGR